MSLTQSRVVRVLVAWAPRIMRLLGVQMPKQGLVLKVSPEGKIVQVRGTIRIKKLHVCLRLCVVLVLCCGCSTVLQTSMLMQIVAVAAATHGLNAASYAAALGSIHCFMTLQLNRQHGNT
jgi:hypothetical protein